MARRSREAIQKRLREQRRAEKAALKRQKRLERKQGLSAGIEDAPDGDEGPSEDEEEPVAAPEEEEEEELVGSLAARGSE